jgi:hypothetical protein
VPLTTTLEEIRDGVRRTADVVAFTDKHPNERIDSLINQGFGALSRLCRTTNPEFQPIARWEFDTDGDETMYELPDGFRSLLMVEYTDGSDRKAWLTPYTFNERALLTSPETTANSLRAYSYRLIGSNLELLPRPPADHHVAVWYATTVTQIAAGDDEATFDTMERLDTYIIWWAAREIAMEREAWERHDRLTSKLQELEGDIRILARSLDLSAATRVTDQNFDIRRRWRRYRR